MPGATLTTLSEYLTASYRPDREYLEGVILERNLGEKDHSKAQRNLMFLLRDLHRGQPLHIFPEQRVQVRAERFRVPDVCVTIGEEPPGAVFTEPPFLCAEVLSRDDRMSEMQERIDDYLRFGVPYVWVIDPRTRRGWVHTPDGSREVKDGVLRTANPDLAVPLEQLFPPTPNQP